MQQFLLFLHVLGAATWFGAGVAAMTLSMRYAKAEGPAASTFHRALADLGLRVQTPAAVVLLVTGIFLVLGSNDAYSFGSVFVSIGFFTIIVGAILGSRFFGPLAKKAADLHDSGEVGAARAIEAKVARVGSAEGALLAITIAAMIWRWGA
ncbi:MAG TPA: hypothetical protein VIY70_04400 [Acidimicrobiia bacterium]